VRALRLVQHQGLSRDPLQRTSPTPTGRQRSEITEYGRPSLRRMHRRLTFTANRSPPISTVGPDSAEDSCLPIYCNGLLLCLRLRNRGGAMAKSVLYGSSMGQSLLREC